MTGVPLSPKQSTSWMAVTVGTRPTATQLLVGLNPTGTPNPCSPVSKFPNIVLGPPAPAPGSASAPYLGQFFFYSNNPENVMLTNGIICTADNKTQPYWLLKETVTGSGRVFLWHGNNVSGKLNSELLIYNPNPDPTTSITVTATGGAVPLSGSSGVDAWFALFNGTVAAGSPLKISGGSFGALFVQTGLPFSSKTPLAFGVVANLSITDQSGQPAQATLFDVAWQSNFNTATLNSSGQQAPTDGSKTRVRGLAAVSPNNYGYWIPVILNPFSIQNILGGNPPPQGKGFTVAGGSPGTNDAFNGADAPLITDPASTTAKPIVNPLVGDYGAQLCFTWPVTNDTGGSHKITFYAGNAGNTNKTNFVINYSGPGGCDNLASGELAPNDYLPFLQDTILANTTVTYRFQIVTIGGYSTPLAVWVEVTT